METITKNRQEIENKDQELVKKFRAIMQNKKKKPAPNRFPVWLICLFTVFLVFSIFFIQQRPKPFFPEASKTRVEPSMTPVADEQKISSNSIVKSTPLTGDLKSMPSPGKIESQNTVGISPDHDLIKPVVEKDPFEIPSIQAVQSDKPSGIEIEEIISCTSVHNRQYNSPKINFSLSKDTTAKVWMNVVSQDPPFTLTHVYYINEKKYCEVPLAIRYPRMRTWSSVTLNAFDHIGRWRVEVVTSEGVKLGQTAFTVVK